MKKILSIVLTVFMLFTITIPAFAIDDQNIDEPIDIIVHGSKLNPYFELNGKIAFCIDPDAIRPSDGVDYIFGTETEIPEIENAIIEASLYDGILPQDMVYQVLQLVIWDILDESDKDYRAQARKRLGYDAAVAFDLFKNAEANSEYSCKFYVYDTSEVPAAGVYQKMATYEIISTEDVKTTINYTVNYYFNDVLINSVNCVENEVYTYDVLPEAEAGYNVVGWTDEAGNNYKPESEFSNLTKVDGAEVNRYAATSPITYKVNYYLDGEFVSSTDCMFGETYTHQELPEANQNITTFNVKNEDILPSTVTINGWYDETEVEVSAGSEYSNLAEINGQEFNFYAFTEYKFVVEEECEETTPIAYKVYYYLDGEFIDAQLCSKDKIYNYMPLPEAEVGYMVNGWETSDGTICVPSDEFSNLGEKNGDVIELHAKSSPVSYKVNYFFNNEIINSIDCVYDEVYTYAALPEAKDGFTVVGWYNDNTTAVAGEEFKNLSNVDEEVINLYSHSEEIPLEPIAYEVHYWLDDTLIDIQYCVVNETYSYLEVPAAKVGYEISGWTDENGIQFKENDEFENLINENGVVNRYAKSKKLSFNVNYYIDGEITYVDTFEYEEVVIARPNEERNGFTFTGWSEIPETMPAFDVNIYGAFDIVDYETRYYLNGELYFVNRNYFEDEVELIESVEKDGYLFSGWDTYDVIVVDNSFLMPSNDVEFFGELVPVEDIAEPEGPITEPQKPTKEQEESTTSPENPSPKPEIEVLGDNDKLPEEEIPEEEIPEEKIPENSDEHTETDKEKPEVEVLGDNTPIKPEIPEYIPNTGDNDVVIISSFMLIASAFAILCCLKKKKETA